MASLTKAQRAERAYLLRELLLRPALRRRENPSPDYTAALTDLIEELVVTDTNGVLAVSVTDYLGAPSDTRHNSVAASRLIMGALETAPGRSAKTSALTANLTHRGFTANTVSAALSWLVEQNLITASNGTATDITGERRPSKARPALPADLVTPRTSTSTSGTVAQAPAPSTPVSNRPNMTVGNLIELPEQLDMGERMRQQAGGSASFDPGDLSAAAASTKTEKSAAPTIPDSVMVAYTGSVLDMWARHCKPTAKWAELPWSLPTIDLPEGATPTTVTNAVVNRLIANGTLTRAGVHADAVWTHTPAKRFVDKMTTWLLKTALPAWTPDSAVTATTVAGMDGIRDNTPSGWNTETLVQMAIDAAVSSGVLVMVDGTARTKPAPPEQKKTETPETETPKTEGDTTSSTPKTEPEGTRQVAPASGQVDAKTEGKSPAAKTPATPPPAPVSSAALERKVDTLTTKVDAIGARLHTLPAPPTKERVMYTDADPLARRVLETVLVQLKLKAAEDAESDRYMTREALKVRVPGRARVTATNPTPPDLRQHLDAALELGRAMGVISYTERRGYLFISHVNVLSRRDLDARVQRVLDIRKAREKKKDAA